MANLKKLAAAATLTMAFGAQAGTVYETPGSIFSDLDMNMGATTSTIYIKRKPVEIESIFAVLFSPNAETVGENYSYTNFFAHGNGDVGVFLAGINAGERHCVDVICYREGTLETPVFAGSFTANSSGWAPYKVDISAAGEVEDKNAVIFFRPLSTGTDVRFALVAGPDQLISATSFASALEDFPYQGGASVLFSEQNTGVWQRIESVPGVPEPETYALFLAGLGLLGAAVRRRKLNA